MKVVNHSLQGLKSGNRDVIHSIYTRLLPKAKRTISILGGTEEEALDVFQEALETILLKIDHVQNNFDGLVLQICRHKWIDRVRKRQRETVRNEKANRLLDEGNDLRDEYIKKEEEHMQFKLMEKTFLELSETCQKLLQLIREGKKGSEIVRELNFSSANTMYRRKFACIDRWSKLIKASPEYALIKA